MTNSLDQLLSHSNILQNKLSKIRPLKEEELKQLRQYYQVGLTYSSNALEGNSLTESETKVVLEDGLTIGGKPLRDHQEALGHSDALTQLFTLKQESAITESQIKEFHHLFFHRIDTKEAGQYRTQSVFLSGSDKKLPNAEQVARLMKEFIDNKQLSLQDKHPILTAAYMHKELVDIHPFIDGNGRVARLVMNLILFQKGYPITIIPPILRVQYLESLRSADSGNDTPFLTLITEMVIEAQKDLLRLLSA